jgi:adenylate cyclase
MGDRHTHRSNPSSLRGDLSPEAIRAQLERILGHRDFEATERTRDFLRFVVEETLAGRANRLKGYTIAIEVFGRPKDFDANLDPIVRIQAGRLRRALEHYYLVAGGADPIRIDVPKGRYVPSFLAQNRMPLEAPVGRPTGGGIDIASSSPTIAVLPLADVSGDTEGHFFVDGLVEELIGELNRYENVLSIPYRDVAWAGESGHRLRELSRELGARFFVGGSVRRDPATLKVAAHLTDAATGQQLWSDSFRIAPEAATLIETQETIARRVIAAVAGVYGAIATRLSRESRGKPPAELSTYEALLRYHHYQLVMTPEAREEALGALRQATEREPDYGPAWSGLATLHAHGYIFDLPGIDAPLDRATEYAQRGVALEPTSQLAHTILAYVFLLCGEMDLFSQEAETALTLNPHSPNYIGTLGYLYVYAGEFERGVALVEEAIRLNPCHPKWFHHALCAAHFARGDYEDAYRIVSKAGFQVGFWDAIIRTAALGHLGRLAEAAACARELLELVPDFERRARIIVRRGTSSDAVVEKAIDGLRKAGLRIDG